MLINALKSQSREDFEKSGKTIGGFSAAKNFTLTTDFKQIKFLDKKKDEAEKQVKVQKTKDGAAAKGKLGTKDQKN